MTAKQYLKQGYRLKELIQTHRDELEQLRSMLGSVQGVSYDSAGGGITKWNGDTVEYNLVIKCVDLEARIQQEMSSMMLLMQDVHDTIEQVSNNDERLVLRCRYILFLSWKEIAQRMNYSNTQVRRLHSSALLSVAVPEKYVDR